LLQINSFEEATALLEASLLFLLK